MRVTQEQAQAIEKLFPSANYFIERTSFEKVFDGSPLVRLVLAQRLANELAEHFVCSPDYLVIPRGKLVKPKDGAIYIRVFGDRISLTKSEMDVYKKYYPTQKFLLAAPTVPQFAWLAEFLRNNKTTPHFEPPK